MLKGTTYVFLQALPVEPEIRLPHSDLLRVGEHRFVTNMFGPNDNRFAESELRRRAPARTQ